MNEKIKDMVRRQQGILDYEDVRTKIEGVKPINVNERLRVFQKTDLFIEKYEQIIKEREDENRWKKTRHERFFNMRLVLEQLK